MGVPTAPLRRGIGLFDNPDADSGSAGYCECFDVRSPSDPVSNEVVLATGRLANRVDQRRTIRESCGTSLSCGVWPVCEDGAGRVRARAELFQCWRRCAYKPDG